MASRSTFVPPSTATLGRRFIGTPSVGLAVLGVFLCWAGIADLYRETDPSFEWGGLHLVLALFAVLGARQLVAGRPWLAAPALVSAVLGVGALHGLAPVPHWQGSVVPLQVAFIGCAAFAGVLTVIALWQRRDAQPHPAL